IAVHLALAGRGRDVDGPVARTADVRGAALLQRLVGADLVALVVDLAVGLLHQLLEDVIEALVLEVALLLRDPFLQPEVRFDDEFAHTFLLVLIGWFSVSAAARIRAPRL